MKIAVIGRTEILYETAILLRALGHQISCILTAKEAPEYTRTAYDFSDLAAIWQVPFAQGPRIVEHTDFLRSSAADIAVSINFTGVVPQSVIDIFPFGVLNAHGGDLPRYRGNACQAWAILNGEERIGLCIHRMIGGELDSGDILAREYLAIDYQTKITQVWEWMAKRTPNLIAEAIEQLVKDPEYILEQQSKDIKNALRCYPRRPEDGRIDWRCPAQEIHNLVRAVAPPYPGAFTEIDGKPLFIHRTRLEAGGGTCGTAPGFYASKFGVDALCTDGRFLALLEMQYEDKPFTPADFLARFGARPVPLPLS